METYALLCQEAKPKLIDGTDLPRLMTVTMADVPVHVPLKMEADARRMSLARVILRNQRAVVVMAVEPLLPKVRRSRRAVVRMAVVPLLPKA